MQEESKKKNLVSKINQLKKKLRIVNVKIEKIFIISDLNLKKKI